MTKKFTPQAINTYLENTDLKVTRLKIDGDKFGYGLTTPREMGTIMEGIFKNRYLSEYLSRKLLKILKETHSDLGVRRHLPYDRYEDDEKLKIVSKGGAIPSVRNEAAIVFAENPYSLVIFSKNISDTSYKPDNEGWLTIAKASKIAYEFLGMN